jgi:hypothetical protein
MKFRGCLAGNKVMYTLYMSTLGYTLEEINQFELMKFKTIREMAVLAKDLPNLKKSVGSSHEMYSDTYKDMRVMVKFPDKYLYADIANTNDPNLHILSEYLAYQIYDLYNISIPNFVDFVIKNDDTLGLVTQYVPGGVGATDKHLINSDFSLTFLVHAFIANWDVFGGYVDTYANILYDAEKKKYVIIDPGGALGFRARGKRKGIDFGTDVQEIKTMSVYDIFRGENILKDSLKRFTSVSWSQIEKHLQKVHQSIISDLNDNMHSEYKKNMLIDEWSDMFKDIMTTLKKRYYYIIKKI